MVGFSRSGNFAPSSRPSPSSYPGHPSRSSQPGRSQAQRRAAASLVLGLCFALGGCGGNEEGDEGLAGAGGSGGGGTPCTLGQTLCGGACVDLSASSANCGACGVACGLGQSCSGGDCVCPATLTACDGACVNLLGSGEDCGACGVVCPMGQVCSVGTCQTSCTVPGQTQCGSSCVDLNTDVANCGSCAATCHGGQCLGGSCTCPATQALCAGVCTEVLTNVAHCGACDNACGLGQSCVGGLCQSIGTGGAGGTGGIAATGGVATGGSNTGGSNTGGIGTGGMGTGGTGGDCSASGFYVEGGRIYDNRCNEFIMRGVNYPHTWSASGAQQRYADIASVGSNADRVVLSTGARWTRTSGSELANIIAWHKNNQLVSILEVHDSTGWSEQSGSVHPDDAVDYWLSSDIRSAIDGNEAYVMINIANEAFGNSTSDQWASFYQGAVAELRNAGIQHTLIVDAPNWAQDWNNLMRDGSGATSIFNADPDRNVVFSVHMYDVYDSANSVTTYFNNFLAKGLPLIVGEFAADHGSAGDVDEATIMATCEQRGVGYLGWSWSGNSSDLSSLDITNNFNVNSLTTWGDRLINGANGIAQTAETCTCFQ